MKSTFYVFETKTEDWVIEAKAVYQKKIQAFFPFEIEAIKSPSMDRDEAVAKKKAEADKFLKMLKPNDHLIIFDEAGQSFATSEDFASALSKTVERSPSRLVFLIGGAFGVDQSVRDRAKAVWSLSGLTMNHWIAQLTALEQIYRALTILKRIPYHNR